MATKVAEKICDGLKRYYTSQNQSYDRLFYKFCENEGYFDDDDILREELDEEIEDNNLIDFYKGHDHNAKFPFDKVYKTESQRRKFIYDLIIKCRDATSQPATNNLTAPKEPYSSISLRRDDKILNGYIRIHYTVDINTIPLEIINLCYKYYHILVDLFKHYNTRHYKLSNEGLTVTRTSASWQGNSSVYGDIAIPSLSETIHQWTFKIHLTTQHHTRVVGIGIDEAKYVRKIDGGFRDKTGESKLYYKWFYSGQVITMELDLKSTVKRLSFESRLAYNRDTSLQFHVDIGQDITYCMAVFCKGYNDVIELVSYNSL